MSSGWARELSKTVRNFEQKALHCSKLTLNFNTVKFAPQSTETSGHLEKSTNTENFELSEISKQ